MSSISAETPTDSSKSDRIAKLRIELKEWEHAFAKAHDGRKPTREETKKDTAIGSSPPQFPPFLTPALVYFINIRLSYSCKIQRILQASCRIVIKYKHTLPFRFYDLAQAADTAATVSSKDCCCTTPASSNTHQKHCK
jgi:hypothetical protein